MLKYLLIPAGLFVLVSACHDLEPLPDVARVEPDEQYTGGANGTAFDFGQNAFGVQVNGLSPMESGSFVTGNSFFRSNWITAPGSVQTLDGLGPVFNAISCGSCHFKDGRARPPLSPDEALNGLLFRLSVPGAGPHGEPAGDPIYGGQWQDKAILGVAAEGRVRVAYTPVSGAYADGTAYELQQPQYSFQDFNYGQPAAGWMFSPRIAQQVPGLGMLELIPENDILALADENDADGDGISGKANRVWDAGAQQTVLGRFGWKANQPTLFQQTAGAFNGDIGITSTLFPDDHLTAVQQQLNPNIPNGGSPEISDELLEKVVLYVRTLAVPARRNHDDRKVLRGKYLFAEAGCGKCHHASWTTGTAGNIGVICGQKIWPYTDLLLHDMGPALADNRPDFLATGSEWRTPPLWGIGVIPAVNGHSRLLHDGRARNVEEAILWHDGEGKSARETFTQWNQTDRAALIEFVNSL